MEEDKEDYDDGYFDKQINMFPTMNRIDNHHVVQHEVIVRLYTHQASREAWDLLRIYRCTFQAGVGITQDLGIRGGPLERHEK